MRSLDDVVAALKHGCAQRADVAALIAHTESAGIARGLSLYTSRSKSKTRAGLGWQTDGAAHHTRTAKVVVNAVIAGLQVRRAPSERLPSVDAFRLAMGVLLAANSPGQDLAPVALSVIRRLVDAGMTDHALTELVALRCCLDTSVYDASVHEPGSASDRFAFCMAYELHEPTPSYTSLVMDAYACALQIAPHVLKSAAVFIQVWPSLRAWERRARALGVDCDRTAFLAERASSRFAQAQTMESLTLRMSALELLMPASSLEADAVWDRAGKVCVSYGLEAAHECLVRVYTAAHEHGMAHGRAYDKVMAWWQRKACDLKRAELGPPSSAIAKADLGNDENDASEKECLHSAHVPSAPSVSSSASWSAVLLALESGGHAEIPAEAPPADIASAILSHIHSHSYELERTLFALQIIPHLGGQARSDGVNMALALIKRIFTEQDPQTLDACIQAATLAHAFALPRAQHTLSTHLFHYGSRLYATKAHAQAARFVRLACECGEASLSMDPGWRPALIKQYHVLAGAYQHMLQYHEAYAAYVQGVHHVLVCDVSEWDDSAWRVIRGAHHVAVFALLEPERFLEDVQGAPKALYLYLLDELMPMLQREEAPQAFEAVCSAALAKHDTGCEWIELRRAELHLLQGKHMDLDIDAAQPEAQCTFHVLMALQAVQNGADPHAHIQAASRHYVKGKAPERVRRTRSKPTIPHTPEKRALPDPNEVATAPASSLLTLLFLVADACLQSGMPSSCIDTLRLALRVRDVPAVHVRLAEVLHGDEAMRALHGHEKASPRAMFVHARLLAKQGLSEEAAAVYDEAVHAADVPIPDVHAWERVHAKVSAWDLQAAAADTFMEVCLAAGQASEALHGAMHALRVRLRMAMLLAQAAPTKQDDEDVFAVNAGPRARPRPVFAARSMASMQYRTAYGLYASYLAISRLYALRGAVRDADAFAQECVDFAKDTSAGLHAGALAWLAEWQWQCGEVDKAAELAAEAHMHSFAREHAAFVLDLVAQDGFVRSRGTAWEEKALCMQAMSTEPEMARELVSHLASFSADVVRARAYVAEADAALRSDAVYGMVHDMARSVPGVTPAARRASAGVKVAHAKLAMAKEMSERVLERSACADARDVRMALETAREAIVLSCTVGRPLGDAATACALTDAAVSVAVRRACADATARRQRPKEEWLRRASADAWHECKAVPPMQANTAAILLTLSPDARELILARYGDGYEPSIFVLPLARQSHRDADDEDDVLTVDTVMAELRQIVQVSNTGVQAAKNVTALDARKAWWTERRALDAQLGELLQLVQDQWLSGLHGLLAPLPPPDALGALRKRVDAVLSQACGRTRCKAALPDVALAALAAMPSCRDDDLEDWLHYALDGLQLSGVPVAQDEVDFDELCVDLRSALDEFHAKRLCDDEHHTYLVLDRRLCELPWESLPVLRSQSVTRLTTLDLLPTSVPSLCVERTAYLLNPSGDLTRSEARFGPQLQARAWHGTIGRAPLLDQVANALSSHDTFLYFGHSGAEMYVHPARLRELSQCAVTMLWGCSSGALHVHAMHDPVGTPYHYAVAQCPALLAVLWDTTDRELDGVCEAVLQGVGLLGDHSLSLPAALAASRSKCKLPYLTGAACVLYGAPVRWIT